MCSTFGTTSIFSLNSYNSIEDTMEELEGLTARQLWFLVPTEAFGTWGF